MINFPLNKSHTSFVYMSKGVVECDLKGRVRQQTRQKIDTAGSDCIPDETQ